jgi:hypothetical protein
MRYQPQGRQILAQGNNPRLAVLPGVNRGLDAVTQRHPTTIVGTKVVSVGGGVAAGFGATFGAGTTDRMTTPLTGAFPATGRSYFFRARRNGAGGSSLGRLFDKTSGGSGQMMYWYGSQARLVYSLYMGGAERVTNIDGTNVTAAAGEWFDVLVTHLQVGSTATLNAWVNGTQVMVDTVLTGTFNDAAATAMSIGNRADGVRGWDGVIECAYVWDRILTGADAVALSANRYSLYAEPVEEEIVQAAAAPEVQATIGWTEQSETFAATAQVKVTAAAAWTEQSEQFALNTQVRVTAAAAWTEQSETTAIAAQVGVHAAAAWVESDELFSATAQVRITAAAAWTEQSEQFAAAAVVGQSSMLTAMWTEQDETMSASVTVSALLSAAWVEQDETVSIELFVDETAQPGGDEIDATLVPPARTVVFEGRRKIVAFEGGRRVVPFEGGNRIVSFE